LLLLSARLGHGANEWFKHIVSTGEQYQAQEDKENDNASVGLGEVIQGADEQRSVTNQPRYSFDDPFLSQNRCRFCNALNVPTKRLFNQDDNAQDQAKKAQREKHY